MMRKMNICIKAMYVLEPLSALVANDAGYADLRHIIELASSYLNS